MIYIGAVLGGPELSGSPVTRAIRRLGELLNTGSKVEGGSLDIVFHIPGTIVKPNFSGTRTAKFSKKEKMLMIQIAVPEILVSCAQPEQALMDLLADAIPLAGPVFAKAEVQFPHQEYRNLLQDARNALKRPGNLG
jgi:hypothetical protein